MPRTQWAADAENPLRRMGFFFAVLLVVLRFGMLHELLTNQIGVNLHLLYILGVPALVLAIMSGGLKADVPDPDRLLLAGFCGLDDDRRPVQQLDGGLVRLAGRVRPHRIPDDDRDRRPDRDLGSAGS